jgi:hypothetical protein
LSVALPVELPVVCDRVEQARRRGFDALGLLDINVIAL